MVFIHIKNPFISLFFYNKAVSCPCPFTDTKIIILALQFLYLGQETLVSHYKACFFQNSIQFTQHVLSLKQLNSVHNIFTLNHAHASMLSHFSCVRLFVMLWAIALQPPLSMGFSRQEYWSGLPFPTPESCPVPLYSLSSCRVPNKLPEIFAFRD